LRKQDDLDEKEQEQLRKILEASPRTQTAYQLVTAFMQMLRERTGEQLENWLEAVSLCQLVEFESFIKGIEQDKAAVLAGLTLPYSNGPLEGQVNRLKLIKKSMYNRANFDLLRIRVLYQSKTSESDRKKRIKSEPTVQASLPKRPGTSINDPNSQHTTSSISEVA
jgi:transposase